MSRTEDAACGALSLAVLAALRSALLSLDGQNKRLLLHPSILSCLMFGRQGRGVGLFTGFNMLKAVLLFLCVCLLNLFWSSVFVSVDGELSQKFWGVESTEPELPWEQIGSIYNS